MASGCSGQTPGQQPSGARCRHQRAALRAALVTGRPARAQHPLDVLQRLLPGAGGPVLGGLRVLVW
ncbi:hypothetical protein SMACR_01226 [Sordaria macrospora]|uniref:Uncharacterized protein n=1 Tax=Sordaria macrospora TaxID=5147 RepID=A0A8S8ZLM5_SORMA|nr:hypothetical protein SMACR_01226 [Sordaria macrospora]WPJ58895.1 hypothetical protein SMAC4_01226 [Sordaria macrospora]